MNVDEKTGKIVSTSTSTDCDLATNIDVNEKMMTQKIIKLQASSSLPDLQDGQSSSPTSTISSNSNNQISGHGKHVILTVESQENSGMNQIDDGGDVDHQTVKQKIKLNIDPTSNGSSSSTSSNNLEYGNGSVSNTSTLWRICESLMQLETF